MTLHLGGIDNLEDFQSPLVVSVPKEVALLMTETVKLRTEQRGVRLRIGGLGRGRGDRGRQRGS